MNARRSFNLMLVLFFLVPVSLACGLQTDEEAPSTTLPSEGHCGDGICDSVEQKDPGLCPKDCSQTGGGASGSIVDSEGGKEAQPPEGKEPPSSQDGNKCEPGNWQFTFQGCGTMIGTEPNYNMCVEVESCISVDENCQIQGTGTGTHTSCEYTGQCTYDVKCSDFTLPISGDVEFYEVGTTWPSGQTVEQEGSHLLKIKVDSQGIYEQVVAHCKEVSVDLGEPAALQTIFGSVARNNQGYFVFIEVSEPQDMEMGYTQSVRGEDALYPGLSYEFFTDLSPERFCK